MTRLAALLLPVVLVMLGGAVLFLPRAEASDPSSVPRLLYPANYVTLEEGAFDFIAVAPKVNGNYAPMALKVAGEEVDWQPFEAPVRVARLRLEAGEHLLEWGPYVLTVYVPPAEGKAAVDWPKFRKHPPGKEGPITCSECHDLEEVEGRTQLGKFKGYKACHRCHDKDSVIDDHEHVEEPLRDCEECHAVHGSLHKALLKDSKKKLCALCHEE